MCTPREVFGSLQLLPLCRYVVAELFQLHIAKEKAFKESGLADAHSEPSVSVSVSEMLGVAYDASFAGDLPHLVATHFKLKAACLK